MWRQSHCERGVRPSARRCAHTRCSRRRSWPPCWRACWEPGYGPRRRWPLDVQDLRLDGSGGWYLHVRQGKGGRDRTVPPRSPVTAGPGIPGRHRPAAAGGRGAVPGGGPGGGDPGRPAHELPGPGLAGLVLPGLGRDRGQAHQPPHLPAHLRPAGPARRLRPGGGEQAAWPRPSDHHPGLPEPPGHGGSPGSAAGPPVGMMPGARRCQLLSPAVFGSR